jgi:hypothetical protein
VAQEFTEVEMIVSNKKPNTTKCSDHRAIILTAHTAKILASILRRRVEQKLEGMLAEDQVGFRRGKGNWDATSVVSIPERTLDIDEELCVCVCLFVLHRRAEGI